MVADIGTTHVAHHLYSGVPCYRAGALTEAIKPVLGDLYLYDPKPICESRNTVVAGTRFGIRSPCRSYLRKNACSVSSLLISSSLADKAVWEAATTCHHIKGAEGTQYYYKKDGSENKGNLPQCRKGLKKSQ